MFDVYSGEGIEQGEKSIAVALYMQHKERTLTDDEVNTLISIITKQLKKQAGAVIRG